MPFHNSGRNFCGTSRFRSNYELRGYALALCLSLGFGAAVSAQQNNFHSKSPEAPAPKAVTPQSAPQADTLLTPATTPAARTVTLIADGTNRPIETGAATVADLLLSQNIYLNEHDRCVPAPRTALVEGATITVTRIRREMVVEKTAIPFPTKSRYSAALPVGQKSVLQPGKNGERVQKFLHVYRDGTRTERTRLSDAITSQPRPQVEQVGTRGMTLASRGFFTGRRIVEMMATGYGPGENGRWGAQTASGLKPGFGVVAVDPRFIPLGTRLYIDGYGYAVAGDTGGAIKGNRIDLGFDNYSTAQAVGRRKVRVLILN